MLDKDTYKRELVRMWNTLRDDEYKTYNACSGVSCNKCPLHGIGCSEPLSSYEVVEIVKKWSKEHQPKKLTRFEFELTRFEFEMLKWLDKAGYKFIVRSPWNNLTAHDSTPIKIINGFDGWDSETEYKDLTEFNELFQFIKWADEEPTSIKEVLENCEVDE